MWDRSPGARQEFRLEPACFLHCAGHGNLGPVSFLLLPDCRFYFELHSLGNLDTVATTRDGYSLPVAIKGDMEVW